MAVDLSVRELVVAFGDAMALDRVSLEVPAGELVALIGPSGCGKTTLLRAIAGFVSPSSGSLRLGGEDLTALPPHRRNAGMVFQSLALWPHMTVAENVAFGLREQRVSAGDIATRVEDALATTRLAGYGTRHIEQLSGGEQQRVALARALVVRPRCLLLDEPLSSLDARLRRSMREEIRALCKRFGLTTLYVTHDQEEALAVADRVAVMRAGQLLQIGTPAEIYRRPRSRSVATFVGETNLIEGHILATRDGVTTVECRLGVLTSTVQPPFAPLAGTPVWVSVRPEALRPAPDAGDVAEDVNRFDADVLSSTFLGPSVERRCRIGETVLTMAEAATSATRDSTEDRTAAARSGANGETPDPNGSDATNSGPEGGRRKAALSERRTIHVAAADVVLLPRDDDGTRAGGRGEGPGS